MVSHKKQPPSPPETPMRTFKYGMCGAKTRSGQPCRQPGMDNGRCRLHGGLTPRGVALPQFKHGRYSKYLPQRLVAKAEAAYNDPDLLSLRDDIALLDVRIADVMEKAFEGEPPANVWREVGRMMTDMLSAQRLGEGARATSLFNKLQEIITIGVSEAAAWGEIRGLLLDRARLVESERRRLVEMQSMIPAEQAIAFANALMSLVRDNVKDRVALNAIVTGATALMAGAKPQMSAAGD